MLSIKLVCSDYGFECDFIAEGDSGPTIVQKLRTHYDEEHGIDYDTEFLLQMVINKGYSRKILTQG